MTSLLLLMVAMVLLGSKVVVDAWDMRIKPFTLEFVQVVTRKSSERVNLDTGPSFLNSCHNILCLFKSIGLLSLLPLGLQTHCKIPTCTNTSKGKSCAGALKEDLHRNTMTRAATGNFSKSSSYVWVPAIIPPHLVSCPGVLKKGCF